MDNIKDVETKFNNLDYHFYFEYSLNFGKAKLSPTHFAILTKNPTKLFIIKDENKTKLLFNNFLQFVKSAHKNNPIAKGYKTGIYTKIKWANKFKYLFKKKPSAEETYNYLIKIFKENGFEI